MRANFKSLRFWLVRGLPLVAAGLVILSVVPADFAAASKALTIERRSTTTAVLPRQVTKAPVPAVEPAIVSTTAPPAAIPAKLIVSGPSWANPTSVSDTGIALSPSGAEPHGLPGDKIGPSAVNVRAGAVKGSAKLFVLPAGAPVRLGERRGGWVHVYADAGDGWIYGNFLKSTVSATGAASARPAAAGQPAIGGRILRVASSTPVHDGPGSSARHLYDLAPGERVRVARAIGNWALIETSDGESGWVRYR